MSIAPPIGGYFELELREYDSLFHDKAAAFNSGRNAFAYILESLAVKKVYIPLYICPVMLQPLKQLQVDYEFYSINEHLEPEQKFTIGSDEYILYVNYFGLKNIAVQKLAQKYTHIIIDNAQAFFNLPCDQTPTFYSPRKFFGVPDGGFAYANGGSAPSLPQSKTSFEQCVHLIKRIELGALEGFSDFRSNERKFDDRSIAGMSRITRKILLNIDYEWVRSKRNQNFDELHAALQTFNGLSHTIDGSTLTGPMAYPYLCNNKRLREHLQAHNIFTPTYWPQMSETANCSKHFESYLQEHLIPLPIDQRYGRSEMQRIVSVIKGYNG